MKYQYKNNNNDSVLQVCQPKSLEEIIDQCLRGEQNIHIYIPTNKYAYISAYVLL